MNQNIKARIKERNEKKRRERKHFYQEIVAFIFGRRGFYERGKISAEAFDGEGPTVIDDHLGTHKFRRASSWCFKW